jgi:hypothetical protein
MRRILLLLLFCAPIFASPAGAQSVCSALSAEGCACAVPLEALPDSVFGQLNPTGTVMVTGTNGSSPAATPVNLAIGDSAVVLESGSATLNAGPSCNLQLPAQSSLVIRAVGECACASVVQAEVEADSGGNGVGVAAAVAGGVVAAGGAALLLLQDDDDDPASP